MDTPRNLRQRPVRNPTPRLSERKKSLFETIQVNSESEQDNSSLDGIEPLNNNNNDVEVKDTNAKMWFAKGHAAPNTPKTSKRISFLRNNNRFSPERMDDDLFEKLPDSPPAKDNTVTSPLRRSTRLSLKPKNRSPSSTNSSPSTSTVVNGKENMPRTPPQKMSSDELPALFTNSMNLNKNKKTTEEIVNESSTEDESQNLPRAFAPKRNHLTASDGSSPTSAAKIRRLDNSKRLVVSTKSFYSHTKRSPQVKSPPTTVLAKRTPRYRRSDNKRSQGFMINKGVHHKIRRKPNYKISSTVMATKSNVMEILGTIRNEKLRKLLTEKRVQNDQIKHVHQILKSAKNPIEMAKPLSVIGTCTNNNSKASVSPAGRCYMNGAGDVSLGFSDIECSSDSEEELEEVATLPDIVEITDVPEERIPTPVAGKKFFKSGLSTTKKEFKVTDNIRASVCNGKMSIMQQKKPNKKKIKLRNNNVNEFSSEQAKVDEILKNFDVSLIASCHEEDAELPVSHFNQIEEACPTTSFGNAVCHTYDDTRMTEEDTQFDEFRRRLPYNTTDPNMIEQQHTLLDFLISNKICTEENFIIFIADPENNKDQAQYILDQLVVVLNESPDAYRQRVPYNTTDPTEIDRQKNFLEFLIENNLCNEENFQIFIADYANRHEEADRIITEVVATTHNISAEDLERELNNFNYNKEATMTDSMELEIPDQNKQNQKALEGSPEKLFPIFYPGRCQPMMKETSSRKLCKTWMGMGLNQYQIDAGQKQFGARQCKQCGLVYTMHEPEEEKLHTDFHASLHVLKFKSWIDEDIVQIYPEWGNDGRILRITEKSYVKRLERLKDVLKIVDKELGFISYILPTNFKAYFAVRQNQIVGVCLVEPLDKAHRYISMNGIDCCTEETYDAKCGISRIWVSPLHRRFHIASKLIRAVQLYTIFSEEIPLDKIAFSAPTEEGKKFAKKVTKCENFLVYQQ